MKLKVGDKAPEFCLPNQDNKNVSFSDFEGKNVLVYFYPADFTPHCTSQACNLRNNFEKLTEKNIIILGISTNSPEKHKKFKEEYELPFDLLSDVDGKISESYDSLSEIKFLGFTISKFAKRNSFIISKDGNILKIMENVEPQTHSYEILHYFENKK